MELPDVRVSARSVVFRYKNKDTDPQQIGRDLNVRAVVTGRVSLRGDQMVIQAELLNVETGALLWGDQYKHNRAASDLLLVVNLVRSNLALKIVKREMSPVARGTYEQLIASAVDPGAVRQ